MYTRTDTIAHNCRASFINADIQCLMLVHPWEQQRPISAWFKSSLSFMPSAPLLPSHSILHLQHVPCCCSIFEWAAVESVVSSLEIKPRGFVQESLTSTSTHVICMTASAWGHAMQSHSQHDATFWTCQWSVLESWSIISCQVRLYSEC